MTSAAGPVRRVALIGTGGTIASSHPDPLELVDYYGSTLLSGETLLERLPPLDGIEAFSVPFDPVGSPAVDFAFWKRLAATCRELARSEPDLVGIVVTHGTATLEETAFLLNLVLPISQTVVVTGSQRPASAFGSDGPLNLLNALRVAAAPQSAGRGVLVMLNDEIHAARDVTKYATMRLQTFRTPDFGVLGHVDGPNVTYYRRPERRHAPDAPFDIAALEDFPRVDIAYSHAGADGAMIDACIAAGARGIVCAGLAPGIPASGQWDAIRRAATSGVRVVLASRTGSGIVHESTKIRELGMIAGDNLNPQKARILLGLCLAQGNDPDLIRARFADC